MCTYSLYSCNKNGNFFSLDKTFISRIYFQQNFADSILALQCLQIACEPQRIALLKLLSRRQKRCESLFAVVVMKSFRYGQKRDGQKRYNKFVVRSAYPSLSNENQCKKAQALWNDVKHDDNDKIEKCFLDLKARTTKGNSKNISFWNTTVSTV